MHSTSPAAVVTRDSRLRTAGGFALLRRMLIGLAVLLLWPEFTGSAADDKRLSIYSPAAGFSVPVVERNGRDYAPLLDILRPLGTVEATTDKHHFKLRFNNLEAEFSNGKTQARVAGKKFDLPANFLVENDSGLVPIAGLSTVLPRFLGEAVAFHEAARRLFIGNAATRFTAELDKTQPATLVLTFSAPVNPTIATEPGRLRMVFTREPLVPPGTQTLAFADKTIPSATFQEDNGAAEIMVSSTAPVMARFSNQGRTIIIAPEFQAAAITAPAPPSQSSSPAGTATPPGTAAAPGRTGSGQRFLVVLDASHGGDERGAALTDKLAEKDVALAMARRLRQELASQGIEAVMLRDSDAVIGLDQRASAANSARPVLYLAVHVSTQGTGVRLYTSLLPAAGESRGSFAPWNAAQSAFLESSQAIARDIVLELNRKEIPVRALTAPLRPLNNLTAPAIALELAPPSADAAEVASTPYQILVAQSVAAAVAHLRQTGGPSR